MTASVASKPPRGLDELNIVLMIGSFAAAYLFPFGLFFVAYAILGPLHYLTEIAWLHERRYYLPSRSGYRLLYLLSALAILPFLFPARFGAMRNLPFGMVASLCVVILATVSRPRLQWAAITVVVVACLALPTPAFLSGLFGLYLPTFVHVFGLTLLFMLHGAIRARKASGYYAAALFFFLPLIFILLPWPRSVGWPAVTSEKMQMLGNLHLLLMRLLGWSLNTGAAVSAMRITAFVYTYHYLNWFSKTRLIGWHRMGPRRLSVVTVIYAALIALYYHDYLWGIRATAFFSIAHVLLELPLNLRTIAGIYRQLFVGDLRADVVPEKNPLVSGRPPSVQLSP